MQKAQKHERISSLGEMTEKNRSENVRSSDKSDVLKGIIGQCNTIARSRRPQKATK